MERIEKSSMYIWMIDATIKRGIQLGAMIVLLMILSHIEYAFPVYLKMILMGALLFAWIKQLIGAYLAYQNTHYQLYEEMIFSRRSGWNTEDLTIPMERVQHVSLHQTFLSRLFKVYSVSIYTAGNNLFLGFLTEEKAKLVKEKITVHLIGKDETA